MDSEIMQEILTNIEKTWTILLPIFASIGGAWVWYMKKRTEYKKTLQQEKDEENKLTEQLFIELEQLKKDIIDRMKKEIATAEEIAEKDKLLIQLRNHCPDCYNRIVSQLNNQ